MKLRRGEQRKVDTLRQVTFSQHFAASVGMQARSHFGYLVEMVAFAEEELDDSWRRDGLDMSDAPQIDLDAAEREAAQVADAAAERLRQDILRKRRGEKRPKPRKADFTLPGGVVPSPEMLSHHGVVAMPVPDRNKPRPLALTGALPRAVKAMVERGELSPDHAKALADYADDCRLAEQQHLQSSELRERVQGGLGPMNQGVAPVVIDARNRVRRARSALGPRIASVVEAVMIREMSFNQAGSCVLPDGQTARVRGAATGVIITAAEVLHGLDGG